MNIILEIAGQKIEVTEQQARDLHAKLGNLFGLPKELVVERPYYFPAPVLTFPEPMRPSWTGTPPWMGTEVTCRSGN
jgi:hypothetical protein